MADILVKKTLIYVYEAAFATLKEKILWNENTVCQYNQLDQNHY